MQVISNPEVFALNARSAEPVAWTSAAQSGDCVTQYARHRNTEGRATCNSPDAVSSMQYNAMKSAIPTKAGIQRRPFRGKVPWIPAFAGMTKSWGCALI